MSLKYILIKYHKAVLYLTTLGLVIYGIMVVINPEVLSSGFYRFTSQEWGHFQIESRTIAAYITLLWRLIGGFNLAVGLTLTLIVWKWFQSGNRWAWTTLLIGNTIAYLSPMSLDLTVKSIEVFEYIEFFLFGLFVITILLVRNEYFSQGINDVS